MILIMNDSDYQAKIRSMIPSNPDPNASFPVVLHRMLSDIEDLAQRDPEMKQLHQIVSWLEHGMAFKVHDRKKFISIVMPTWFVRLKHTSWVRQLNLYAFKRVQEGPDKGAIYHENFIRGRPDLARSIMKPAKKQKGSKSPASEISEIPDFQRQAQAHAQAQQQVDVKKVMESPASAPSLFDLEGHHRKTHGSAGTGYISSCGVTFGQPGSSGFQPPSQAQQDPLQDLYTSVFHPLSTGEGDSFSSLMPQQMMFPQQQDQFIAGHRGAHGPAPMPSSVARMPMHPGNTNTGHPNIGQHFPFPMGNTMGNMTASFASPVQVSSLQHHPHQRGGFATGESKETFEGTRRHSFDNPFPLPTASALTASFLDSSQNLSLHHFQQHPGEGEDSEELFDLEHLEPVPFAPHGGSGFQPPHRGPHPPS